MLKKFCVIFIVTNLLTGCIPLAIGGVAAVTVAVIYLHDQRTTTEKDTDAQLRQQVERKLNAPVFRQECHIVVNVFNGYVLLAGQAPTKDLKIEAQRIALTTHGILKLYNQIQIAPPISPTARAKDYWISTRIKIELMKNKSLQTAQLTIITEDGTVYLMGAATTDQITTATDIVSKIAGVKQVVQVFPNNQVMN